MSCPIAGRKGKSKVGFSSEEWLAREALENVPKSQVFDFLSRLGEQLVLSVIGNIRGGLSSTELRNKVATSFLVRESIKSVDKPQKSVGNIQKMLRVSVTLLRQEINRSGHNTLTAAEHCLRLYDLLNIDDNIRGTASAMLRDCGAHLDLKEMRKVLSKVDVWVVNREKRPSVRNLVCAGYLERNGAELAFVALENDNALSKVSVVVPDYEIIETLKLVVGLVGVFDAISINRARAIFWWVCRFPGEKQAMAAVTEVRPDLIGYFTDDSDKIIGKKAK